MNDRAPAVLRGLSVAGVVVGLVLGVVGWIFLGELDRTLEESLTIGENASATLIETIDVADQLIVSLDDGLGTVSSTLDAVESSLSETTGVARGTADLASSLPASLDDIDVALETVEALAEAIDTALRAASRIPLGPDYDPAVSFPDAVGNLRGAFAPIGDDLDAIAVELDEFARGSADLGDQVDAVRADLARTRLALARTDGLLADYRDTAIEAGALAADSRDDMSRNFLLARFTLAAFAAFLIASQFVPWWLAGSATVRR